MVIEGILAAVTAVVGGVLNFSAKKADLDAAKINAQLTRDVTAAQDQQAKLAYVTGEEKALTNVLIIGGAIAAVGLLLLILFTKKK